MEVFIETRFGDPVLSIDISNNYIVYGSALGQIGIFQIASKEQLLITELAEEGIKGLHILNENLIYASIGDLYLLVLKKDQNNQWHSEAKPYDFRQHSHMLCNNTLVLQCKSKICLVIINNFSIDLLHEKIEMKQKTLTFDCISGQHEEYQNFYLPKFSVPFDYTQDKLIWMEIDDKGTRVIKSFSFISLNSKVISYLSQAFGIISNFKVVQDTLLFVHDLYSIKVMEINSGAVVSEIARHKAEIIDFFPFIVDSFPQDGETGRLKYVDLVVSVDVDANVYLWQDGEVLEMIDLGALDGILVDDRRRFFAMGYPYVLKAFGMFIVISTDLGIIVLRSDYLANLIN